MNNERRKALQTLAQRFAELLGEIENIRDELDSLKSEEEDYYNNMPESFQNGEKGERAQAATEALQTCYDMLDEINGDEFASQIETACE